MHHFSAVAVIVFLLGVILLVGAARARREKYGGPIKVIRRIPVDEANAICDMHFRKCLVDTGGVDFSLCARRRENCRLQARYSFFHRL
uniref:Uncharacterized protein n=1 Tax=Marseillevirus LCMAC103 TaxID=2506604 RepID=A0A481YUR0_9VIRU|nr:MAG: hypothetical protein LCMAC103_02560 [Marseillevirus LCMAC103]